MRKLVVNFKGYAQSTGNGAIALAAKLSSVSKGIILAPQFFDIREISKLGNPVFAQHVDPVGYGSRTGMVIPEAVRLAGGVGSIISHSEHRMHLDDIKKAVERCREAGLQSLVCVPDVETEKEVIAFEPDMIAIEPPELIGSGISVSRARPELIEEAASNSGGIELLCGAGISSGKDVERAIELGANGVLVASAIVKSNSPESMALEMVKAL